MEDCMIEEPCGGCGFVMCNCPPEPEDESEDDKPLDDLPMDWEPDFNAETGRERHEREYREKYQ